MNAPAIQQYLAELANSPFAAGTLEQFVEINPRISLQHLPPDLSVSFLPMDAVEDQATGRYRLQTRLLSEVQKGYTPFGEGDIVWAKITPCMQNGKSAVITGLENGLGFGSTEFHVLRPRSKEVLAEYVWYFLSFREFLEVAKTSFTGSAGQQRVPQEFLKELPFPLPPLPIQQELVASMNAARTQRQQQLAEAEALLADFDTYLTATLGLTLPEPKVRPVFAIRNSDLGKRVDAYSTQPRFRELFARMQVTGLEMKTLGQLAANIFSGTTPTAGGAAYVPAPHGVRFVRSGEITKDGGVMPTRVCGQWPKRGVLRAFSPSS
jgi:type I restriction enzyme S subunit